MAFRPHLTNQQPQPARSKGKFKSVRLQNYSNCIKGVWKTQIIESIPFHCPFLRKACFKPFSFLICFEFQAFHCLSSVKADLAIIWPALRTLQNLRWRLIRANVPLGALLIKARDCDSNETHNFICSNLNYFLDIFFDNRRLITWKALMTWCQWLVRGFTHNWMRLS